MFSKNPMFNPQEFGQNVKLNTPIWDALDFAVESRYLALEVIFERMIVIPVSRVSEISKAKKLE